MIARLLEEISWEKAVKYRRGGRGMENVLTAEVLVALDLLPRSHFFAAVVDCCSGAAGSRTRLTSVFHEVVAGGVWLNDEKCS